MKDGDVGTFFICDETHGIHQVSLRLRVATHESWYETTDGLNNIVDPYMVDLTAVGLFRKMTFDARRKVRIAEEELRSARKTLRKIKRYNPNR